MRPFTLILCATLLVSGCARVRDSQINPLNWFARSQSVATTPEDIRPLVPEEKRVIQIDNRVLVQQVTGLTVTSSPGGVLVQVDGVATTQGAHSAQLVHIVGPAGTMAFAFRVQPSGASGGSVVARQISVATFASNADLNSVRSIQVQGETNTRSLRR